MTTPTDPDVVEAHRHATRAWEIGTVAGRQADTLVSLVEKLVGERDTALRTLPRRRRTMRRTRRRWRLPIINSVAITEDKP